MGVTPLDRRTYLPDGVEQVAQVHEFLAASEQPGQESAGPERAAPMPRYFLTGGDRVGEQVELPPELYLVLRQVVEAMRANLAVTVTPQAMTLTPSQAADLLGVSRPTVVKLLEEGRIPFERIGTHRRVLLADLLTYREQRRSEQYAALAAMSSLEAAADAGLSEEEVEVDEVLQQLRQVRHIVAGRRKSPQAQSFPR